MGRLQFFILQPAHVPSCLALPPKLPERGRSFSRPVSRIPSLCSLFSGSFPSLFWSTYFRLSLPSLSRSLSKSVCSSHLIFSFSLFPQGFGSHFVVLQLVIDRCFRDLPVAPYIPPHTYTSGSRNSSILFFSFNRRYIPRRKFYLSMQHRYDPATALYLIRPPYEERKLTGLTSRRREYNIVILGAGKQQLLDHSSIQAIYVSTHRSHLAD